MLQIAKCDDRRCCNMPRCPALAQLLPERFLPPQVILFNEGGAVKLLDRSLLRDKEAMKKVHFAPFAAARMFGISTKLLPDSFVPSLQGKLTSRVCPKCEVCDQIMHRWFIDCTQL